MVVEPARGYGRDWSRKTGQHVVAESKGLSIKRL
jgi:hypothetical protein